MMLELPAPRSIFDITLDDGAIARIRRHGETSQAVRLFLSHGNGFAIDGYLPFWQPLLERFDVILFDYRNHGWNPPSDPAHHTYAQLARDVETIYQGVTARLGAKTSVGVFHSLAARTAIKHAVEMGWRWDALVLFDPSNVPPQGHPLYELMRQTDHRLADWARSRQERFTEPGELAEVFKNLRAHQGWVAGAHELMARAILRQDSATGDWVLICPGALEAKLYLSNLLLNLWPAVTAYGGPVKLIGADPTVERPGVPALTSRELALTQGYVYETMTGAGHMMQLEQPEASRRAMLSFLAECGLLRS